MSRLSSMQAKIISMPTEALTEEVAPGVSIREEILAIPDDYLLSLWNEVERAVDKESVDIAKEQLRLELCNVLSILNYCEENELPYIVDRVKVFKQIDAITRYPKDPFVWANKEILLDIGYSIKPPCVRVFERENKVLSKSYTSICFHPMYGKYTHLINKIAYLPLQTKPKATFKKPELDIDMRF